MSHQRIQGAVALDRRMFLRAGGAVAVSSGVAAMSTSRGRAQATPEAMATPIAASPGTDWTTLQGDPARTGVSPDPGVGGEPTLLWRYDSLLSNAQNSPVIADGVVYFTPGRLGEAEVTALDLMTGELLWSTVIPTQVFGAMPAIADGAIYVAGMDGTVVAIDLESHEILWNVSLGTETTSSPVIAGDLLAIGGDDDVLRALDRADGTERWRVTVGEGAEYNMGPSPSFADGMLLYSNLTEEEDRSLHAVDAITGEEWWVFEPDEPGLGTASIRDGIAYAGGDGGAVYAVDLATGDEVWKAEVGRVLSAPAVTADAVIVQGIDGLLASIDRATGEVRWQTPNSANWGSPVVAGDIVHVGVDSLWFEMGMYGYDLATGEERWYVRTDPTLMPPAISGNVVVVADGSAITALVGSSGTPLERGTNGEGAYVGPIVFSAEVDEDGQAIDPAPVLEEGAMSIFASFDAVGLKYEDPTDVTWWLDGEVITTRSEPWQGTSSGRFYESITSNEGPLPAGTYEIELAWAGVPTRRGVVEIR